MIFHISPVNTKYTSDFLSSFFMLININLSFTKMNYLYIFFNNVKSFTTISRWINNNCCQKSEEDHLYLIPILFYPENVPLFFNENNPY